MKPEQFVDSILAREENIVPSSGFVESVMQTIQRKPEVPMPLPFPWKRALPGLVALPMILAFVPAIFEQSNFEASTEGGTFHDLARTVNAALADKAQADIGLVILVLLGSFAAVKLCLFVFAAKR